MDLEFFNRKKILLTGGSGYLAYNLIDALKNTELEVTRFDLKIDNWSDFDGNFKIKIKNIEGDIRDRNLLESILPEYDIIFHFAAQTSIYVADINPINDIGINLMPLVNILDICEKWQLKPIIIFSGTATQVGLNGFMPVDEQVQDNPVTIYDLNKSLSEKYLGFYCRKGVVRGSTLRLANVYGPGPKSGSNDRGIVNLMVKRAIDNKPLTIYGTGEYTRDYIYIKDVVNAFLSAAINIDKLNGKFFYIGSGKGHTIVDMIKMIVEYICMQAIDLKFNLLIRLIICRLLKHEVLLQM